MAIFNFSITVPDDKQTDILDSLSDYYGWHDGMGVTRADLIRSRIGLFLKREYQEAKREAARKSAGADADLVAFD